MAMASYTGCYTDATNKSSADAPLDLAVKVSSLSIASVLVVGQIKTSLLVGHGLCCSLHCTWSIGLCKTFKSQLEEVNFLTKTRRRVDRSVRGGFPTS